jgi:phosphohistidine phosphatase
MRELLIVRHAIAHERNSVRFPDDDERPLTRAGKERFSRVARALSVWFAPPDELLSSSLLRAKQTARILTREARFPKAVMLSELRPETATAQLIASLTQRRAKRVAIVGHEPSLSLLVAELLNANRFALRVPLKKGGIALIAFRGQLKPGAGTLIAFIPPRAMLNARRSDG